MSDRAQSWLSPLLHRLGWLVVCITGTACQKTTWTLEEMQSEFSAQGIVLSPGASKAPCPDSPDSRSIAFEDQSGGWGCLLEFGSATGAQRGYDAVLQRYDAASTTTPWVFKKYNIVVLLDEHIERPSAYHYAQVLARSWGGE